MLNPEPHRLLKRQLDKFLSFETEITPDLAELFRDISAAYQNYDQELDLMRRALDENSVELDGARRQIQAHLEEVQDLKSQQDGDYFLTSLLINPLGGNNARSNVASIHFYVNQIKKFRYRKWDFEIGGDMCISHSIRLYQREYNVILNADAMGKSMQGAAGALVLGAVFHSIITRTKNQENMQRMYPEAWLRQVYQELHNVFTSFNGSMLIACCVALLDTRTGLLYYIKAEHPQIVLYRNKQASFLHEPESMDRIGLRTMDHYMQIHIFPLQPGDVILIGSDGRDDILLRDPASGEYDMNDDPALFLKHVQAADGVLADIVKRLERSGVFTDDVSLIRIQFRGSADSNRKVDERLSGELSNRINDLRKLKGEHPEAVRERMERIEPADMLDTTILIELYDLALELNAKTYACLCALRYSELQPEDTDFLLKLSALFYDLGDVGRAMEFTERYCLRVPSNLEQLKNLLRLSIEVGRREKALRVARQILMLNSEDAEARNYIIEME
ncbi:MAG: serine/threonine-protein phosphatase [Leptospiraceae bacterium]|nr:serine/threonine-protein phosphatase [Leptospiraceae bacterium]